MGQDKFADGLTELGFSVSKEGNDRVVTDYTIHEGRFANHQIKLGIIVPGDFEITPPSGIHISPRLIPVNPNAPDHSRATDSPLGNEWQYLSRPFPNWPLKRTVKRYMEYVAHLLDTL